MASASRSEAGRFFDQLIGVRGTVQEAEIGMAVQLGVTGPFTHRPIVRTYVPKDKRLLQARAHRVQAEAGVAPRHRPAAPRWYRVTPGQQAVLPPCNRSWSTTWVMTRHPLPPRSRRRRRLAVTAPLTLTLAGLSLLIAACGGGASPSSVASVGKATSTTVAGAGAGGTTPINPAVEAKHYKQALKFSQCMRAHGIADFPDPNAGGGIRDLQQRSQQRSQPQQL